MMNAGDIPNDIREFIKKHIRSVAHLDVVILLGKDSEKKWNAQSLSQHMRTNPSYALLQLQDLARSGLLKMENQDYSADVEGPDFNLIFKLEEVYNLKRSTVINFIYSQPMDTIQSFADAFKIKKD